MPWLPIQEPRTDEIGTDTDFRRAEPVNSVKCKRGL